MNNLEWPSRISGACTVRLEGIADVISGSCDLVRLNSSTQPNADASKAHRGDLEKRLGVVTRDLERFAEAIATTGPVPALLDAITAREQQREALTRDLRALVAAGKVVDWRQLERDLEAKLRDWQGLLQRHVPQARQVLKKLLHGHIVFQPHREEGQRYYTFTAPLNLGRLLTGMASANMVASPPGIEPGSRP